MTVGTDTLGAGRVEMRPADECLGTLDESSAALGLAKSFCSDAETKSQIEHIQQALYRLMTEVAASSETVDKYAGVTTQDVFWVEEEDAGF